jgi:hypothetical protein
VAVVVNTVKIVSFGSNGIEVTVLPGVAIPANTPALLVAGSDGTDARYIRTAADGTVRIDPTGTTTQPISAASLPLPTGAATEATLTTLLTTSAFQARINTLGQKTMANSTPVVISSDQSAITVTGTVTANIGTTNGLALDATVTAQSIVDNAGFSDAVTRVTPAGFILDETAGTALTENDAAAARIDSKRAQVLVLEDASTRGQRLTITAANAAKVDGSAVTQPISAASLPLPSGAATESTLATRLADATFTGRINTLGQKTAANSTPVVLASDKSVPIAFDSPGTLDVFGSVITSGRYIQAWAPFFQASPSLLASVTVANGGSATQGTGTGVFSTGVSANGQVSAATFDRVSYSAHHEIFVAMTAAFTTGVANSYQRIGLFDATDGFFFGYNGTSFGLWHRYNGVDTFVAQASWNTDTLSGAAGSRFTSVGAPIALDPTKLNIYSVRFGWLGIANAIFEVMAPDGNMVVVHVVRFPNVQTTVSLSNPNLPLAIDVKNTAGGTNLVVTSGCWVGGTTSPSIPPLNGRGTISALNGQILFQVSDQASLSVDITGTWVGTLVTEYTIDGFTWHADTVLNGTTGAFASSFTSNAVITTSVGSYRLYRIRASAWTSGSAVVAYNGGRNPGVIETQAKITDATGGGPVAVKIGGSPGINDPALCVVLSPNQAPIPVASSPSNADTGSRSGYVLLGGGTAGSFNAIRATVYTEPTANAQRSIASANAADTSAGTGARTVEITYYTQTCDGPFTETVTLNGTTPVNTVATNICFIESIVVKTIGSGGANAGIITLYASTGGGGGTIGTIAVGTLVIGVGDNRTLWSHHYVAATKTASLTSFIPGGSGSTTFLLRTKDPTSSLSPEIFLNGTLITTQAQFRREFPSPVSVVGPARIVAYGIPTSNNFTLNAAFDFYEETT